MKIAIDCSKAVNEKAGIARYTWEVASNMPEYFPRDEFLYFFNFIRRGKDKQQQIEKLIQCHNNIASKVIPIPGLLKESLFPKPFSIMNSWLKKYDIYHATEFLSYDKGLKIPQVLTVHDLALVRFPEHRGEKESKRHIKILKEACLHANSIVSVSESTKNDIIKYFDIPSDKINVVYSGYNKIFRKTDDKNNDDKIIKKYEIDSSFILFVGTIEPRKNIINLMKAFEKFGEKYPDLQYQLIIIGKKGWNTDLTEESYSHNRLRSRIKFLDYVEDKDLLCFYNNCELFCYPSIFEGFGFPPLEAMACGAPVVTSRVSSLPEICGKAAYYIDPSNPESIYESFVRIIFNKELREDMKKKSLLQARKFSWEKCVKETHGVYERCLKQ